jgi:hypothetical protein
VGRRDRQQWRKHFQGKTTPIDRRYNKQNHQKNTKTEKNKKKKKKEPENMSPCQLKTNAPPHEITR